MLNKIISKIKIFFHYLPYGLKAGDKLITHSNSENSVNNLGGLEEKQEEQNVYKDLLRNEVTEEVKEIRREMYQTERKVHEYKYGGGGRSIKVDDTDGENEENVILHQKNYKISKTLDETGIRIVGEKVEIDEEKVNETINNETIEQKNYIFKFGYRFIPRFRLEHYLDEVTLREKDEKEVFVDLYIPAYKVQYDNISKLFQKEIENIYNGNSRSDILSITNLYFITYHATGLPDLFDISLSDFKFIKIAKNNGFYILTFTAVLDKQDDIIAEFIDQKDKEEPEKYQLEGATFDYLTEKAIQEEIGFNAKEAEEVINRIRKTKPKRKNKKRNKKKKED